MIYYLNTEIPEKKTVPFAIQKIFGIGKKIPANFCKLFGINKKTRFSSLTLEEKKTMLNYIEKNYTVSTDLKKSNIQTKEILVKLRTYRGLRLRNKLPVRGQRTHTNAKTSKRIY
jgi:small subunit ribosomal protein S13